MFLKHAGVVALATASALVAGSGVVALARGGAAAPPPAARTLGEGRVAKAADGHFWATAEVGGAQVRFLVDTGSSVVALTPSDARRIGLDPARLKYDRPVITADGGVRAAAVMLDHIAVGDARISEVPALVLAEDAPASLLGMSYLGRLSRFEATPDALILSR